jgi:hypothetical protein
MGRRRPKALRNLDPPRPDRERIVTPVDPAKTLPTLERFFVLDPRTEIRTMTLAQIQARPDLWPPMLPARYGVLTEWDGHSGLEESDLDLLRSPLAGPAASEAFVVSQNLGFLTGAPAIGQLPGTGERFEFAFRLPLHVSHEALVDSDFEHVPDGDSAYRDVLEWQGWIGNAVVYLPLGAHWAYLTAEDGLRLYSFDEAADRDRFADRLRVRGLPVQHVW